MDQNNRKCSDEQAIKKSLATLSNAKSQNAQCGNKPRSRFSWRGLLSYLPSWFRTTNPDSAVPGIEATPSAKPSPAIQICHAKACTPGEAGSRHTQQEIMEKRSLKKPSYERILSSFNFEDVTSDQKACSEPCKQSGLTVCGKHSNAMDSSGNKNSKPIQIGVAEVSSHKGSNGKHTCACNDNKTQEVQKTPISMSSNPSGCKQCMDKHPSSNSTCRESLLEQAWAYLQSLISAHRSGCQRCNQQQSNDQMNARTSNDSNTCKETLLEQAVSYLKKITLDHRNGCSRCQKQPSCNSSETSYLQTMLEQAWLYFKKMSSNTNVCCQSCKQSGRRICCKHSTSREQSPPKNPCCTTHQGKPQGILKYSSSTSGCHCSSQTTSIQEFPKKQSCPPQKPMQSCPKISENKSPQPLPPIPHLCRSSEERLFDKNSCFIPYCKQNSQHSNVALTGSHHKSCCLSQLAFDPQKPACTGTTKKSFDSIDIPIDYSTLCPPYNKKSSVSQVSQEILEYRSSAKCGGPCENNNSKNSASIKQGISLSQEPNDHKFCTRPKECKHSKQSLEESNQSRLICSDDCAGACSQYRPPEEDIKPKLSSCSGGCIKCNQSYTATPMYKEQRKNSEYEDYLDEHYGKIANQLLDDNKNNTNDNNNLLDQYNDETNVNNEPVCDNGCSCVTCIELIKPPDKCSTDKGPRSDPHNYRYYY